MGSTIQSQLDTLLQTLYRAALYAFPHEFRAEFGEEMADVFDERLAAARERGSWAILALGWQELGQMPAALLRLHLYRRRKQWRQMAGRFCGLARQAAFRVPPPDNDGRFSRLQFLWEMTPFIFTAILILVLTYRPPAWLPSGWQDPLDSARLWTGALALLVSLLGLARGMPRWAYPYAGLLAGYTLWAAAEQRLVWLWGMLLIVCISLAVMAAAVHHGEQALPTVFRRLGASVALDWTRVSFGAFGAAPLLVLASFDDAYLNRHTANLALALLVMVVTAMIYSRCQRQDRQLAALLGGATLLFVPAVMENSTWQGGWDNFSWLIMLWACAVALLLLPLLAVPVQWSLVAMSTADDSTRDGP